MSLVSFFAITVLAAGSVISPLPDTMPAVTPVPPKPDISFGQITTIPHALTPDVLGVTKETTQRPTQSITKKQSYTIALLGDSMIDTLGPGIPALQSDLQAAFNRTKFTLLNYGVGGTNIDYGIDRITNGYTYLGKRIPALSETHPDIVVLESFAYNPFPVDNGINRHWLALARAVDTIRANIPGVKIIIAATIAPNSRIFGDGAEGLAFSIQDKIKRTTIIKQYLDSTVKFAAGEHLPVADAYHTSLTAIGDGDPTLINSGDHIHYSDAGRALFAQKITEAIVSNRLLE